MNFSAIRIVLIGTTHPGNIGATARAMKTMGFTRLYLVQPKIFPDQKAYEMAAGADDILANATVVDDIDKAFRGCQIIFATSARPRGIALPGLTPGDCAKLVSEQEDDTEVAIVFGREHAGLTNDELLRCHYHIQIPSNPEYGSLNLAQAVQILCYELRMNLLAPSAAVHVREDKPATQDEIEGFYHHLIEVMQTIDFYKPENPGRLLHRLRRLFNRVGLEKMEVNILRGILKHVQIAISEKE